MRKAQWQHNTTTVTQFVCYMLLLRREQHGTQFIEGERDVGAVTTGGNAQGTVTAQHNGSDSVCAALLQL